MTESNQDTRLLVVDDDHTFRRVMTSELSRRGYAVSGVASGRDAVAHHRNHEVDVTLLDLRLPDMNGIEVLAELRAQDPDTGVIVLTGHGTIDTAIQAIRLGAYDYLEKPCPIEKLEITVQKTREHVRLVKRQKVLEDGYSAPDLGPGVVGASRAFKKVLECVGRIAPIDATTLIQGETGVGKDVIANLLHANSHRSDAAFVVVDCATLHEELLQSELFGHEAGSFTGAARRKHGLFEVANGGTIFLDEVGEMSLEIQAMLLRVLETSRFRRLGGTTEIAVDVRVIAATNRNLRLAIERGHFREDLYYRLATLRVDVPPLRERREDIRLLVEHFTAQFNVRFNLAKRFGAHAMETLESYSWPGNVRELIHVIEQTVVLTDGDVIGIYDLPPSVRGRWDPLADAIDEGIPTLGEVERRHVLSVLEHVDGNRAEAARILGVSERNLYRLIKRYGAWEAPSAHDADDGNGEPSD